MAGEAEALPKVGMGPLAAAAAPLLDLLARLVAAVQVPNPEELRERAIRALRGFEADGMDVGGEHHHAGELLAAAGAAARQAELVRLLDAVHRVGRGGGEERCGGGEEQGEAHLDISGELDPEDRRAGRAGPCRGASEA